MNALRLGGISPIRHVRVLLPTVRPKRDSKEAPTEAASGSRDS